MSLSTDTFVKLAKSRRTFYQLTKESPVPDSRIEELINDAILHVPSSFNSQSTRLILLLHEEHDKLWDIAINTLEKKMGGSEQFLNVTKPKLEGFKRGYGTILFYEDPAHIPILTAKVPIYKEQYPVWAQHTNAMHQYFLWTALESLGLGVSLQHYNPLIDAEVAATYGLPTEWSLVAQMPFGVPAGPASEKTFKPVEERVKVFGKKGLSN